MKISCVFSISVFRQRKVLENGDNKRNEASQKFVDLVDAYLLVPGYFLLLGYR